MYKWYNSTAIGTQECINEKWWYYIQVISLLRGICTSNSMGSSEIWDKYHECCIGNGDKFHEAKPSEIYHFQYNKSGIYPKFHCYPCYSQLIPYSLHMRILCISFAICTQFVTICTKHASTLIGATLLT